MVRTLVRMLVLLATPAVLHGQTPDSTHDDTTTAAHAVRKASGARLTRAYLDSLPIDDQATAFAHIPGVFLRGPDVGIAPGGKVSIRGGADDAAATYIDGAPVRSFLDGTPFVEPALNAIGKIVVTTGLGAAELSDIQNGIISYEIPAGDDRLQTHWSAHTDNPFGSVASVGYNRFAGDVSGPLPGVRGLTLFASGFVEGQSSEYLGFGAQNVPTYVLGGLDTTVQVNTGSGIASVAIPKFVQVSGSCDAGTNGADCQGLTRPFDWRTGLQFAGKVRYEYAPGSSLSVTGMALGAQLRAFPGTVLGDPALFSGLHEWTRFAALNWHQRLTASVALDAVMSIGSLNSMEGALDPSSETATRDPSLGIELSSLRFSSFGPIGFPLSDQIIKNLRTNSGLRVPLQGQTQLSDVQPYRMNPYAMSDGGLITGGSDAPMAMSSERRRTGRWELQWRLQHHAVTAGIDADGADLTHYETASVINANGLDAWTASPKRLGWFAQDLISLGPAALELGARIDRVNPGVLLPNSAGFIFNDPAWDHSLTSTSPDAAYQDALAKVFTPTRDQTFLTPRIRFGWEVDRATAVWAGLGQTLITPPVAAVATGSNADLTYTSVGGPFGRDVNDGKATNIDLGVQRWFGTTTSAELSVYDNFDIPNYFYGFQSESDPTNPGRLLSVTALIRGQDSYARGLDLGVTHSFGPALAGSLSYGLNVDGFEHVSALVPVPTSFTTQALAATVTGRVPDAWTQEGWRSVFRHVGALAELRMISGPPYTPLANQGFGTLAPDFPPGAAQAGGINSENLPWTKVLDLRLTKGVRANGVDWTIFADFRNLLNIKNLYGLYAETNGPTNPLFQARATQNEYVTLENEAASNGALLTGNAVSLSNCGSWTASQAGPVNCVLLRRAEARFGNGDGTYTVAEQANAFNAYFNMVYGSYRFYGPQRTVRVGLQLGF